VIVDPVNDPPIHYHVTAFEESKRRSIQSKILLSGMDVDIDDNLQYSGDPTSAHGDLILSVSSKRTGSTELICPFWTLLLAQRTRSYQYI
jgi:hypothetical protein